ncbi:Cleavage induced conserved protein [Phytophthora cinnamomi]|uniref:Cleavage induced conserved protein n=1 Tax=Phytophthora cinnamomi TaxID=4785 RepID=UPI003559FE77|nr:Cleavage induced conserved protein [Phytophthora cinnamomi]
MKLFVVATIALAAFFASEAEASKKYVKLVPNGANVPNTPAIGHTDGTGDDSATNSFGDAFAEADYTWTKDLCEADSDGDGQTNGQELGDPCCEWAVGGTPQWTTGVSNPGDASSTSDPSLWANSCGASTSESTSETTTGTSPETTTGTTSESSAAGSTDSEQTDNGSDDGDVDAETEANASNSTAPSTSGKGSTTAAAEKCASDLASTRALRASN